MGWIGRERNVPVVEEEEGILEDTFVAVALVVEIDIDVVGEAAAAVGSCPIYSKRRCSSNFQLRVPRLA